MQKITFEDVEIVVRRATVRDGLKAEIIGKRAAAQYGPTDIGYWTVFADLCSQTVSSDGLPFDPTTLYEASDDTVCTAYEQYLDLPKDLVALWRKAVIEADKPADNALGPVPIGDTLPNAVAVAGRHN